MARRARGTSRSQRRAEAVEAARAVRVPGRADVAVVGGGPAGLAAAVAAAGAGAGVVVLERDVACGRTILPTGNGRCNLSNARLAWARYNDPAFVEAVCGPRFGEDVLGFLEACGIAVAEEGAGRLYPLSRQAASVRDALLGRARRAGAVLACARGVTGLAPAGGGWRVTWDGEAGSGALAAGAVVLATGGGAGLGGTLGLRVTPLEPVLCPLSCEALEGVSLEALDGRRAHVTARLLRDGAEVARERGEALFRAYGVSGIAAFDLSRAARPGDTLALDLTDGLDSARARCLVEAADGSLAGIVDPAIAAALGGSLERARDLRLVVRGPAEAERAQVTRGGLACDQFDPATLGARGARGLLACGEALDVDGACGGFNLAWAWKSGLVAGAAAAAVAAEGRA
ncbi:NAD(P)/FAD-dependent oxidoreductase [Thermophilibacter sp.]